VKYSPRPIPLSSELLSEISIVIKEAIRKINLNILEKGSKTIVSRKRLVVMIGEENQSESPDKKIPNKAIYATLKEFFLFKKRSKIIHDAIVTTKINSGIKKLIL